MLEQVQESVSYRFRHAGLLSLALTHSSAANEQQNSTLHNERLEFLGDAVLELCISHELYKRFPHAREGQLTAMRSKLVNQESLAGLARKLRLDTLLVLGKGEESQGGRTRDSLLSDALEAVLGAIFEDGGFAAAHKVVARLFADAWPQPDEKKKNKDPKSQLQEVSQQRFRGRPVYGLVAADGPEHAKVFSVQVALPDGSTFLSSGSSVKRAEQTAARTALQHLLAHPEKNRAL